MNILPGNMRFGAGQPVKRLETRDCSPGRGSSSMTSPTRARCGSMCYARPMLTPGSSRSTPGWPSSRLRLAFTFLRSTRAVARLGAAARLPAGGGLRIICRRFAIDDASHQENRSISYPIWMRIVVCSRTTDQSTIVADVWIRSRCRSGVIRDRVEPAIKPGMSAMPPNA